jgi:hypothetical protein
MIGQSPGQRRPISLLVHIAFHFLPHRWQYLERVITGLAEFEIDRLLVVVDSNTADVSECLAGLSLPKHCEVRVHVHPDLAHPFDLTWAHRKHMASSLDAFDYFMYLEDDIYVPSQTFAAWVRRSESVYERGYIHGFLRVEFDPAGRPTSSDWRRAARRPHAIEIDGVKYIRPEWFYQACWVYSRAAMQRFVSTAAWTRGIHRWSSVVRGHRHSGDANYTREFSAFGMACAAPGRPRILLPVNDSGQVLSDAWVYHLPNTYAQSSELQLLDARHLVEGGLGARQGFDSAARALEVQKWAAHLLYVNEAAQFIRAATRRFLSMIKDEFRSRGEGG